MNTAIRTKRNNPPRRSADDTRFTFQISRADLAKFKLAAKKDQRSISSWIRLNLVQLLEDAKE